MTAKTFNKAEKKSVFPKIVTALIIILILAGGAFFYLSQTAEKRVAAFLSKNGLEYTKLETKWNGHFTAHDVKKKFILGIEAHIGSLVGDVSWSGSKSNSLHFDDIDYQYKTIKVSIPSMDIKKIVMLDDNGILSAFLNFNAEEVIIPTADVKNTTAGMTQTINYQNLIYKQVHNGSIAKIETDKVTVSTVYKDDVSAIKGVKKVDGTFGSMTVEQIDLAGLVAYYTQTSAVSDDSNPVRQIFGPWTLKDGKIVTQNTLKSDSTEEIAEISGKGFSTRLLSFSLIDWLDDFQKTEDGTITDEAKVSEIKLKSFDVLKAVGAVDLKIKGLKAVDQNTDTTLTETYFSYDMGRFNMLLSDMKVKSSEGHVSIDRFAINDLSFPKAVAMIRELQDSKNSSFDYQADLQQKAIFAFIPHFKHFEINGVNVEPVDGSSIKKGKMDSLIVDADFSRDAIPTSLRIALKGIEIPIAELDKDLPKMPGMQQGLLKTLGYDGVNTDLTFDASWNEKTEVLELKEFSYRLQDLGNVIVKANIGNVNEAFFTENPITIATAALGARAIDLNVSANFDGLINRLETYSKGTDTAFDLNEQRRQMAMQLRVGIAVILGADMSQKIGEGLQNFIEKGGTIEINAKAKSERGLGMLDFVAAQNDPLSLLEKIDLSAQTKH